MEQNVRRFDVAVDDTAAMGVIQRARKGHQDLGGYGNWNQPVLA